MVVVRDPSRERGRLGSQPHHERGTERSADGGIEDGAAGRGQHDLVAPGQRLEHDLRLQVPVRGFAALLPELADGLARSRLNGAVDVDEGPARGGGDDGTDGRFARAHQADHDDRGHEPTRNACRARLYARSAARSAASASSNRCSATSSAR